MKPRMQVGVIVMSSAIADETFGVASAHCDVRWNDYLDHHGHFQEIAAVDREAWTVVEAKAKFSEVIDKAVLEGPQTVTRRGRKAVVIVDAEEWERKSRRSGSLAAFLATSPLRDSGLEIERSEERLRDVDL